MSEKEKFENDVKMYGTQTVCDRLSPDSWFENDVKMYGTQTCRSPVYSHCLFENDVKMYGTQTIVRQMIQPHCLRMM